MATIGIMDSGLGGLSVFREIRKVLPDEQYIYYADSANCPYGEKTAGFIQDRARAITEIMISKGAAAMVIACNTATAVAIGTLRAEFEIPFIGMEPAVKPAALGTQTGVIGVLATAGTLNASKYLHTREQYENEVRIVEHVGSGFVELVESGCTNGTKAMETVKGSLKPLLDAGADTIVLGCTHYPFLLGALQEAAAELQPGKRIHFIDPAPAVARQLVRVLDEKRIPLGGGFSIELLTSGDASSLASAYNHLYR